MVDAPESDSLPKGRRPVREGEAAAGRPGAAGGGPSKVEPGGPAARAPLPPCPASAREGAAISAPGGYPFRGAGGAAMSNASPPGRGRPPASGGGEPPASGGSERRGGRDELPGPGRRRSRDEAYAAEAAARELIDRGDRRGAIEWLASAYGDELYSHCYRLTKKNDALAKDALQDAYVRAYKNVAKVRPDACLRTWLRTVAYHRVIDLLRAPGSRAAAAADVVPDDLPASACDAEAWADLKQAYDTLEDAVAELAPEEQYYLALRYEEGLSYEEMSELCGKKANTIQARVARALVKLRHYLEKRGVRL
ncbi:MAG TPA: sigma-70 family RNA polymerase sigma factor [Polyangiaceae bacterium]|nr:sigma-70 family RNA polymerase sigma factor [Polyangiaceae bacterium]